MMKKKTILLSEKPPLWNSLWLKFIFIFQKKDLIVQWGSYQGKMVLSVGKFGWKNFMF